MGDSREGPLTVKGVAELVTCGRSRKRRPHYADINREAVLGDATCLEVSDSLRDRNQLRTIAYVASMNATVGH